MASEGLNEVQISRYHRDGVLYPLDALSQEEAARYLQRIEETCEDLLEDDADRGILSFRPWEMDVHPLESTIRALAEHPAVLAKVRALLGPHILVRTADIYQRNTDNRPGLTDGSLAIEWHWDDPWVPEGTDQAVTVWLALTASTPHNGAVRFVEGSHQTPIPREAPNRERCHLQIGEWAHLRDMPLTEAELKPGQFSLHHPCIVHCAEVNKGEPNFAIAIRYFTPNAPPEMVGSKSGTPVMGEFPEENYSFTPCFPFQWWEADARLGSGKPREYSNISVHPAGTDGDGYILAHNGLAVMQAVESVIRNTELPAPTWTFDPGQVHEISSREKELPTELSEPMHFLPITTDGAKEVEEISGFKVFDADGLTPLRWRERMDGLYAIYTSLKPAVTLDAEDIYDVGPHMPPIALMPRRLGRQEEQLTLSTEAVAASAFDIALWAWHHGETLQCQTTGPLFVLPGIQTVEEAKLWNAMLEAAFSATYGTPSWSVIVDMSSISALCQADAIAEEFGETLLGFLMQKSGYASSLFQEFCGRRSTLSPPWETQGALDPGYNEALAWLSNLATKHGVACWERNDSVMARPLPRDMVPEKTAGTFRKTGILEPTKAQLDALLMHGLKGLDDSLEGKSGCGLQEVDACRSQVRHWLLQQAPINGKPLCDADVSRMLRDISEREGVRQALPLLRQSILNANEGGNLFDALETTTP